MSEHTSTPWSYAGSDILKLQDGEPLTIADCDMDPRIDHDSTSCANAAHIVKCVNGWDGLVVALEAIAMLGVGEGEVSEFMAKKARAALAKVTP